MATVDLLYVNCYMIAIQIRFICYFACCFSASDVTSNKVRTCGRLDAAFGSRSPGDSLHTCNPCKIQMITDRLCATGGWETKHCAPSFVQLSRSIKSPLNPKW